MNRNNHLFLMAIVFVAIVTGALIFAWSACQNYKAYKYRRAYLIEKQRADAAERLINLCRTDIDDWHDMYSSTEEYRNWQGATDASINYFNIE